jgi:hypothetical protein
MTDTPTSKPKSSRYVFQRRVEQTYQMLIWGYMRNDVIEFARENWHVSERQARRYLDAAYERFAETASRDRQILLGIAAERFSLLFNQATTRWNIPVALAVLQEANNLLLNQAPFVKRDPRLQQAVRKLANQDDGMDVYYKEHGYEQRKQIGAGKAFITHDDYEDGVVHRLSEPESNPETTDDDRES